MSEEKRFEAICELGKAPFLVDNSAKWVNSNGCELTVRRAFQGDYNVDGAFSDCYYFADLLNDLYDEKEVCREQQVRQANTIHQLLKEKEDLARDRRRLLNYMRRELEYDEGDEIYNILHNKFYDSVWWDEENEYITPEYIEKEAERE